MHTKRIIPCLDVKAGRVVKGVNFVNLIDAGDPVEIAAAYDKAGADELVFLDITASSDARNIMIDMVRKVAEKVFIPFTVGGGIRTVDDFKAILREGADKISINSSAINTPNLINDAADKFGSQCVVVAIDAKRRADGSGWNVYKNGGRIDVGLDVVEWAMEAFTVSDLWKTPFFIENTRIVFHKPYADNESAHNEYDKVLAQPLKLLAYAHVLELDDSQRHLVFGVHNMEMLEYIASRERNAFNFLQVFFRKVVSASGIERFFKEYKESCTDATKGEIRAAKNTLYDKYHRFISANTPTKSKLDTTRMLHKVLNVFAYSEMMPGSNCKLQDWGDLMYNKVNWRDEYTGKEKTQTRNEAKAHETDDINANFYIDYQVNKAIKNVKRQQGDVSEVQCQ